MKVIKFGGAVLNSIDGFGEMLKIVKANSDNKCLLVISAFSKSTRNLKNAAQTAEMGDIASAVQISNELYNEYCNFATILLSNSENLKDLIEQYDTSFENLNDLLKGISITRELTDRTLDAIMSFGETLSLLTAFHYLNCNGIRLIELNSTDVIITDDSFGSARPILDICEDNIKSKAMPLFGEYNIVLTQGFVAANRLGETTTMGIESSNLTAAIYAKYLNAEACIIYTDVEGIRSADPKLYADTVVIPNLSYEQAYLLGVNGLKLIFPDMVELIRESGIEIQIKSAYNQEAEFTVISKRANDAESCIAIEQDDYSMMKVEINSADDYSTISAIVASKLRSKNDFIWMSNSELRVATKNPVTWNCLTNYAHNLESVRLIVLINLFSEFNTSFQNKKSEIENMHADIEFRLIQTNSAIYFLNKWNNAVTI